MKSEKAEKYLNGLNFHVMVHGSKMIDINSAKRAIALAEAELLAKVTDVLISAMETNPEKLYSAELLEIFMQKLKEE